MPTSRTEAFSDGVIAIIITIMVLELRPPEDASLQALWHIWPKLLSYILSFIYIGIYWNNHHHLLQAASRVSGSVMWANLHWLFWQSLVPFVTEWMGDTHFATQPVAAYGFVLLMNAVAFTILTYALACTDGKESALRTVLGDDRKGKLSLGLYAAAIGIAFLNQYIACALFAAVAIMWFIPDTRFERASLARHDHST